MPQQLLRKDIVHTSALLSLQQDEHQTLSTRSDSSNLACQSEKLKLALIMQIWNFILERFDNTSEALQSSTIDIRYAIRLYDSLLSFSSETAGKKDVFYCFEMSIKELCETEEYREESRRA